MGKKYDPLLKSIIDQINSMKKTYPEADLTGLFQEINTVLHNYKEKLYRSNHIYVGNLEIGQDDMKRIGGFIKIIKSIINNEDISEDVARYLIDNIEDLKKINYQKKFSTENGHIEISLSYSEGKYVFIKKERYRDNIKIDTYFFESLNNVDLESSTNVKYEEDPIQGRKMWIGEEEYSQYGDIINPSQDELKIANALIPMNPVLEKSLSDGQGYLHELNDEREIKEELIKNKYSGNCLQYTYTGLWDGKNRFWLFITAKSAKACVNFNEKYQMLTSELCSKLDIDDKIATTIKQKLQSVADLKLGVDFSEIPTEFKPKQEQEIDQTSDLQGDEYQQSGDER